MSLRYLFFSLSVASSTVIFRSLANDTDGVVRLLTQSGYSLLSKATGGSFSLKISKPGMGVPGFMAKDLVDVADKGNRLLAVVPTAACDPRIASFVQRNTDRELIG